MEMPVFLDNNSDSVCEFEHGMSKTFVSSLRELYIILNDKKTGAVKFVDIANKWVEDDDAVPDLPKGLINCLRKVTPPNGLLTFDRFCAGVRVCLLKNQTDFINNNIRNASVGSKTPPPPPPASSPPHSIHNHVVMKSPSPFVAVKQLPEATHLTKPTASVSPVEPQQSLIKTNNNSDHTSSESSSVIKSLKTKSMPQLMPQNKPYLNDNGTIRYYQSDAKLLASGKNGKVRNIRQSSGTFSKSAIMKRLINWRDNVLGRQTDGEEISDSSESKDNLQTNLPDTDAKNLRNRLPPPPPVIQLNGQMMIAPSMRRSANRREPRRHTVGANGIDFNTIKRLQQLEQEREVLLQGLDFVHRSRDWYLKHIAIIQDKLRFVGRDGSYPTDYTIDAYQERINFLAARVLTVNQHLAALMDSERGFPIHMNLAIRPLMNHNDDPNRPKQLVINPNVVNRLKEQNRLLTDEVSRKSERITVLEREKSALIRELFQTRAHTMQRGRNETDDTTFM